MKDEKLYGWLRAVTAWRSVTTHTSYDK